MQKRPIFIYGASGFAREVAWLIEECEECIDGFVAGFIDDDPEKQQWNLNGYDVYSLEDAVQKYPDAAVVGGVGTPHRRETMMNKAFACGLMPYPAVIHPTVRMSNTVTIEEGAVICAGNVLTVNIAIGKQVQINLNCTVGHDAILEDYVTLAPGVHVSGYVHIRKNTYIGTGVAIINGNRENPLVIGENVIVGAGACVTKSIPDGVTAVGVPARWKS